MNITTLTERINEAASAYQIGGLQQFRAKLHEKKPGTFKLFSGQTTFVTDWGGYAFHHGGRTELQFNVGIYAAEKTFRHGVAFSFERTQSLPDPLNQLGPKVARFNHWVRTSGQLLKGFKMWHYDPRTDERSEHHLPGEISEELLKAGAFVFLGKTVSEARFDVDRILRDFDTLLPLYQFVESDIELKAPLVKLPEEIEKSSNYKEGSVEKILVNRYERDPHARDKCIQHFGTICVLCKFDFVGTYGPIMEGFIHVHHVKQLAKLGSNYRIDPISDLRPVCPNCHAVLHRREPPYSLDQVLHFLQEQEES
jgi:hypothetical protein